MPSQSRLSTLNYKRQITTTDGTNITADTVSFAFVTRGTLPTAPDWHVATYLGANVWALTVGPTGAVTLAAGSYDVWQKVADNPETSAEHVDIFEVT